MAKAAEAARDEPASGEPAPGEPALGERVRTATRDLKHGYSPDEDRPLGSYVGVMAAYTAAVAALAGAVRATGTPLPERMSWSDVALITVATHKVARLLTKETVTSPLRAPFTRFRGPSGDAELAEEVTADGPRHVVGELLTCPFCTGHWAATALTFGIVLAPRPTRLAAVMLTALTGADFLHLAYAGAQQAAG